MADSCFACIDSILGLLAGIEIESPIHQITGPKDDHASSTGLLRHDRSVLKFLKAQLRYITMLRHADKTENLASLLEKIEAALKDAEAGLSADLAKAYEQQEGDKMYAITVIHNHVIHHILPIIVDALDVVLKVPRLPMSHHIVFVEFVASVQAYLESVLAEFDACLPRGRQDECLPYHWFSIIVRKLEILNCFLENFEKRCIDKEKLQLLLARAGAMVFSIGLLSFMAGLGHRQGPFYNHLRFCSSFIAVVEKISPFNQEAKEIYVGVLQGYVEILKAAKPSPGGSVSSLMVEKGMENSFLTFILSSTNRVDILHDALAFPLVDDVPLLSLCAKDLIEDLFFKRGIAAVVREAGCLDQSNDLVEKTPNYVLRQKMKLIKAEIFLLELHNHKAVLMVPATNHFSTVIAVIKSMTLLSESFKTPKKLLEEPEKLSLALIQDLLREVASSYNLNQEGSFTEDVIAESSVAIFKIFKAEASIMVLINNEASTAFLAKYRIESLHKGVILLRAFLLNARNKKLEHLSKLLGIVASEAALLVCSFGERKIEKDLDMEMYNVLSFVPKMIDFNIAEIETFYQQNSWSQFSNFPKTHGFAFVGILLEELRELLTRKPEIVSLMNDQVQVFMEELELVMSLRNDVAEHLDVNDDLGSRFICLVYEGEYVIDLFVTGEVPLWYHQLLLASVILETKLIKAQVLELYDKKCDRTAENVELALRHMTVKGTTPEVDELRVGVDDQAQVIIEQLISGRQQLDIVSIVGMPGLGKTTLAKKVYAETSIQYHFKIRGWCCVSQVYHKRDLILDILSSFIELTDKILRMDDGDLSQTLYQALKKKRFLIVMDDMWTIQPWMDLKRIFPDDKNGSRVLFTSRNSDVALQANPTREPHPLRFLSDEESWELLQKRVFDGEKCPDQQLLEVGGQIARSCKGVPLAIVVMSGVLKGRVGRRISWKEIDESVRSRILDDPKEQFMHILEKSYSHLPDYLKPCFLYLGAFLADREIPIQKLKLLWIAEGFLPKADFGSLEKTADKYMAELIGRSLVMESRRRSRGGTKACQVHDMIRDFCLKKATGENFMQLVSTDDRNIDSERYCYPSDELSFALYRVCVHSEKEHFMQSLPVSPHVHSLLFFGTNTKLGVSYELSIIPYKLKLLRVLDLECISFSEQSFPSGIELLFRLRYLAIRGKMNVVPSTIANLWNLETLILKGTHGEIVLPDTLWSMDKLSHVEVHSRASFVLPADNESITLAKICSLSSPAFTYGRDTEKLLRILIGLKKLRCIFLEHRDNFRRCTVFPAVAILTQLESLKILYHGGRISFPCEFSFPKNLKKLTLSKFRLPWEYISAIRQLENLEVLKLLSNAFEGQTWDMEEGEFPSLKFLKLENLNIETWSATTDNFPQLEKVVLQSCKKLEEVPSSFGEIPTLQTIEMQWCSQSAAKSLETIYEQQLDFGNRDFKVMISPPDWDFRASSS